MFLDPVSRPETIFTYGAPALKFGTGARFEIAADIAKYSPRRVLFVTDKNLMSSGRIEEIVDSLAAAGSQVVLFDDVRIEPTDVSVQAAVDFARESGPFDVVIAVGGGSVIDTAKAMNLMVTNPGELMEYVNAPIGDGRPPTNDLLPLVAVPTTTGTGSESTTICVLDITAQRVKTGISHAMLRPTAAVVDPELTVSQPALVTAASGLDVLCHALESYTARGYTSYEAKTPQQRVPYCGSNPISDQWSEQALSLLSGAFRAAVSDGSNVEAREQMALAATFAGLGFGNAGVHIPHANAYPIASQVRDYWPHDYPARTEAHSHGLVPHGMAVSQTAPAAFRFTFEASPERHIRAATLLAPNAQLPNDPAEFLPQVITEILRDVGMPSGLAELGFTAADIPELTEGTLKQQRLLSTAPRVVREEDVETILSESIELW